MFSLEMLGFYSDAPGSQTYPPLLRFFYPDRGNFIAFVADLGAWRLLAPVAAPVPQELDVSRRRGSPRRRSCRASRAPTTGRSAATAFPR
jgi:hypothetical protein